MTWKWTFYSAINCPFDASSTRTVNVTLVWAAPLCFLTHTLNGQNGCATYFVRQCIRHHWHNGNGDITSKQNLTRTSKVVFITSILLLSRRKYLLFYWRLMTSMREILAYTFLSFTYQTKETEIRCAEKVNCSPLPTPFICSAHTYYFLVGRSFSGFALRPLGNRGCRITFLVTAAPTCNVYGRLLLTLPEI